MRMFYAAAAVVFLGAATAGCVQPEGSWMDTYTLYRNSSGDPKQRHHVATFDTAQGNDYNQENCAVARDLFMGQEGVKVTFWCEKGRYRP